MAMTHMSSPSIDLPGKATFRRHSTSHGFGLNGSSISNSTEPLLAERKRGKLKSFRGRNHLVEFCACFSTSRVELRPGQQEGKFQ